MFGNVSVKTPPAALPLLVAEVKRGLRVDGHDENETLRDYLAQAVAMIDGPDGIGVALMAQTWTLTLDGFPHEIRLPGAPVTGVERIRYLDRALEWQVIDPAAYRVVLGKDPARVVCAPGFAWPRPVAGVATVEIDYFVGAATRAEVQPALLGAVRLLVGHFFENREAVAAGVMLTELPLGVQHILDGHRRGVVAG